MQAIYLYINAVLYVVFAAWCSIAPGNTATSIGYERLSAGGRSEYLVVYGGLQLGLAVMFWLVAREAAYNRLGMLIAIAFYVPIVAYRVVTIGINWPVSTITLATGTLEALLLVAAIGIFTIRHP